MSELVRWHNGLHQNDLQDKKTGATGVSCPKCHATDRVELSLVTEFTHFCQRPSCNGYFNSTASPEKVWTHYWFCAKGGLPIKVLFFSPLGESAALAKIAGWNDMDKSSGNKYSLYNNFTPAPCSGDFTNQFDDKWRANNIYDLKLGKTGVVCPKCHSDKEVELSGYNGRTHFCNTCAGWFNSTSTVGTSTATAAAAKEMKTMKLHISRTALIDALTAYVSTKTQEVTDAQAKWDAEQAPFVEIAKAQLADDTVAKRLGYKDAASIPEDLHKSYGRSIARVFGVDQFRPITPTFADINTLLAKLNLSTDETIELDENDPALQWFKASK